jgi:hypothetical protein
MLAPEAEELAVVLPFGDGNEAAGPGHRP